MRFRPIFVLPFRDQTVIGETERRFKFGISLVPHENSNHDKEVMKTSRILGLAAFLSLLPVAVQAQGIGVAAHVGSMGVGADIALHFSPSLGVRVGGNFVPADISFDAGGLSYDFDIPPRFTAMLDLHPGGSAFRISVGVMKADDISLSAAFVDSTLIGGILWAPSDVGTLTAEFDTKDLAPYVGIGIGNPAGGPFGFFLDIGVGLWGTPQLMLAADGALSNNAIFINELAVEQAEMQNDIDKITVYPVFSIGFSIGFGR